MLFLYFICVFFMSSSFDEQRREPSGGDRFWWRMRVGVSSLEQLFKLLVAVQAARCSLLHQYTVAYTCLDIKLPVSHSHPHRQYGGSPHALLCRWGEARTRCRTHLPRVHARRGQGAGRRRTPHLRLPFLPFLLVFLAAVKPLEEAGRRAAAPDWPGWALAMSGRSNLASLLSHYGL